MSNFKKSYKKSTSKSGSIRIPKWYSSLELEFIKAAREKSEIENKMVSIREQILTEMKRAKRRRIETPSTIVNLIDEFESRKIDSAALKIDYPDIYEEYSTPYTTKENVRINIKRF